MIRRLALSAVIAGIAGLLLSSRKGPYPVRSKSEALADYATPLPSPSGPQRVFHLGHSLVGRDMPAMLAQMAGSGHLSHFQIGWGTSLRAHWDDEVNGLVQENNHPAARRASDAIDSGQYDAIVFTEMVEIRDAIRFEDSAVYLHRWAQRARAANASVRLYFYESWPTIDDREGWLFRVERDLGRYWEDQILLPVLRSISAPIYMVPGGQALAACVKAVMAHGEVDGVSRVEDFFSTTADGEQDTIHLNDLGNYVIAATHLAVIYQAEPTSLPTALRRADGSAANMPGPVLAEIIQRSVWDVVTDYTKTGIHRHV